MFTSCYIIRLYPSPSDQCVRVLCACCLARCGQRVKPFPQREGGAVHVGTNGLGHSWPNIVVVAGKRRGGVMKGRVGGRQIGGRGGLDCKHTKGAYHLNGKAFV